MSQSKEHKKHGGAKKIGRNKRPVNQNMRAYTIGSISFEEYAKRAGVKFSNKH
jgi:hypothetical protein